MSMLRELKQRADDRGIALPFIAIVLALLLGMAAFAVDLGWIFLNGARVQRAADSAALAGVIYLPGDTPNVSAFAINGAQANGYDIGTLNGALIGGGPDDLAWKPLADNKLEVTLDSSIETFFLKVFGFNAFDIKRVSTAEYIKPVPIGNPDNSFGDGSDNFWASINGRWTAHMQGDPFQTRCDWATSLSEAGCIDSYSPQTDFPGQTILPGDLDSDGSRFNPEYRGDGYYYGVEVQSDRLTLTLELFDPEFRRRCGTGTGDCDSLTFSPLPSGGSVIGPTTRYRLYKPDLSPLDPTDNTDIAESGSCDAEYSPTTTGNQGWVTLCTVVAPEAGIYVLRVSTSDGSGSNQYGVRGDTTGPGPNTPGVYGINEISIFTNQDSTTGTLYLAEIDPVHAGKTLELRFYDAGEDNGQASYTVKLPDGTTATCSWEADGGASGPFGPCTIATTVFSGGSWETRFNAQWLTVEVDIPGNYSCDPNDLLDPLSCWWTMEIVNNQPHDRTTWTAKIIGNPVKLTPNE